MSQPTFDLSDLFDVALQAMTANRQDINALDGYNGNHGDNMVENLRLITDALQEKSSQPPAEALQYASHQLQSQGHGGTSQYYATGLSQAADQFQGRSTLDSGDLMSMVQSLLGAIPAQGHPQQTSVGDSVLGEFLGGAGGPPPQPEPDQGIDAEDVLGTLLSAGLSFLQAKQAGADTTEAATQAVMNALLGGQMNPLQARTARSAAGGLVAQSMLQALASRR
jgi:hypothetical protein